MLNLLISLLLQLSFFAHETKITALPQVAGGKIERVENFKSKFITARNIDVWLPPSYSDSTKFSVLYMHDGQMLFDPEITWNKQSWNVDEVSIDLLEKKQIKNFIVVAIWNDGPNRHADYFPQKPYDALTKVEKDTVTEQLRRAGRTKDFFIPQSDLYLKFIVTELKPYIDQHFSVHTQQENTFIAGSSMGGLISIYALCEYPEIFGGAACLSTHWPGTHFLQNNPFPNSMIHYLAEKLPHPLNHKLYFDCGDKTLDAIYPAIQLSIDSLMTKKGYTANQWLTQYFPGDDHTEKSWSRRLHIPLSFLLKK
jgi:enterochelin esterase-like enzyme